MQVSLALMFELRMCGVVIKEIENPWGVLIEILALCAYVFWSKFLRSDLNKALALCAYYSHRLVCTPCSCVERGSATSCCAVCVSFVSTTGSCVILLFEIESYWVVICINMATQLHASIHSTDVWASHVRCCDRRDRKSLRCSDRDSCAELGSK